MGGALHAKEINVDTYRHDSMKNAHIIRLCLKQFHVHLLPGTLDLPWCITCHCFHFCIKKSKLHVLPSAEKWLL